MLYRNTVPNDEVFWPMIFTSMGAINSHCEEAVRSVIVRSVRGKVRDLMKFIGFRANMDTIVIGIEKRFGRGPSADKLQQKYYQLQQEKRWKDTTVD